MKRLGSILLVIFMAISSIPIYGETEVIYKDEPRVIIEEAKEDNANEESPLEENPVDETPVDESPVDESPVVENLVDDKVLIEETLAEDTMKDEKNTLTVLAPDGSPYNGMVKYAIECLLKNGNDRVYHGEAMAVDGVCKLNQMEYDSQTEVEIIIYPSEGDYANSLLLDITSAFSQDKHLGVLKFQRPVKTVEFVGMDDEMLINVDVYFNYRRDMTIEKTWSFVMFTSNQSIHLAPINAQEYNYLYAYISIDGREDECVTLPLDKTVYQYKIIDDQMNKVMLYRPDGSPYSGEVNMMYNRYYGILETTCVYAKEGLCEFKTPLFHKRGPESIKFAAVSGAYAPTKEIDFSNIDIHAPGYDFGALTFTEATFTGRISNDASPVTYSRYKATFKKEGLEDDVHYYYVNDNDKFAFAPSSPAYNETVTIKSDYGTETFAFDAKDIELNYWSSTEDVRLTMEVLKPDGLPYTGVIGYTMRYRVEGTWKSSYKTVQVENGLLKIVPIEIGLYDKMDIFVFPVDASYANSKLVDLTEFIDSPKATHAGSISLQVPVNSGTLINESKATHIFLGVEYFHGDGSDEIGTEHRIYLNKKRKFAIAPFDDKNYKGVWLLRNPVLCGQKISTHATNVFDIELDMAWEIDKVGRLYYPDGGVYEGTVDILLRTSDGRIDHKTQYAYLGNISFVIPMSFKDKVEEVIVIPEDRSYAASRFNISGVTWDEYIPTIIFPRLKEATVRGYVTNGYEDYKHRFIKATFKKDGLVDDTHYLLLNYKNAFAFAPSHVDYDDLVVIDINGQTNDYSYDEKNVYFTVDRQAPSLASNIEEKLYTSIFTPVLTLSDNINKVEALTVKMTLNGAVYTGAPIGIADGLQRAFVLDVIVGDKGGNKTHKTYKFTSKVEDISKNPSPLPTPTPGPLPGPTPGPAPGPLPVKKSLEIVGKAFELEVGSDAKKSSTSLKVNAKNLDKDLMWTSSNEAVALVDNTGLVTAVGVGKTVITVRSGTYKDTCDLEVFLLGEEATPEGSVKVYGPYIKGYDDNTFKPKGRITRAEVASILAAALNLEYKEAINYSDVKKKVWYYDSVQAVSATAIFSGYPTGDFRPNAEISRSEMAKVILNLMTYLDMPTNLISHQGFTRDHWATEAIYNMYNNDYVLAYSESEFLVDEAVRREEMVYMMNRIFNIKPSQTKAKNFYDVDKTNRFYGDIKAAAGK